MDNGKLIMDNESDSLAGPSFFILHYPLSILNYLHYPFSIINYL